ncbi:hypothetical protein Poli38472_010884 [Pythium oligandrum]|uniref:Protein kinase domain-containing protein n=1 Tax=Pythium oligandrum TaxID=41045 RepID=A0A8K1CE93_PYTOL|nr:hypothetical protein Poli38472_010884 [Pythium oligandrum]|eukprot:TMW61821.1 hypothetical protein Poli38472_010884 [Pythium oligandrum]
MVAWCALGAAILATVSVLVDADGSVSCPVNTRDDDQKPVIIADCKGACGYDGLCIYYPYRYRDACAGVLANRCLEQDECTFECFEESTTAITFYQTWEDMMVFAGAKLMNSGSVGYVNASLVQSIRADAIANDLVTLDGRSFYPAGPDVGNAPYVAPSGPIPYEVPKTLVESNPDRYGVVIASLPCPPFPPTPQSFPSLYSIGFVECGLTELPWDDYEVPVLEWIFLQRNHLRDLPTLPPTVTMLDLGENAFTSVPKTIASLPLLEDLNLKHNPLKKIPENSLPATLSSQLLLKNCSLSEVPSDVAKMTKLKSLELAHNNLGDSFDESKLPSSLVVLSVGWCGLKRAPTKLPEDMKLTHLDISGNELNPDDIGAMPSTIQTFRIQDAKLSRIPSAIGSRFPNLTLLDLTSNPLEAVESGELPATIKTLVLSGATFTKLVLPSGVKTVNITDSNLEEVPSHLNLDTINLSGNKIKHVDKLSASRIYLAHNEITSFTGNIDDAEVLDLSFNQLSALNLSARSKSLKILDLRGNNLTAIPYLRRQHGLQVLDLRDNPIKNYLPSTQEWEFLRFVPLVRMDVSQLRTGCSKKVRFKEHMICDPENPVEDLEPTTSEAAGSLEPLAGDSSAEKSGATPSTLIVIAVVIAVAIVLLSLAAVLYYRRRSQNMMLMTNTLSTNDGGDVWQDEDLTRHRLDASLVQVERLLGVGISRQQIQQFVNEIKMMANFRFPKIVRFIGVVWTKESDVAVVTEYMAGGDLRAYLDSTKRRARDGWTMEKYRIALDIAEALVYLHSLDPPMIHRDLKSCNVLLDGDMNAALSDFGTTREIDDGCTMTAEVGTALWMAPEVLHGRRYDQSADIYSLGVILSELDTHELPFRNDEHQTMDGLSVMGGIISGSLRVQFLRSCPESIRLLALRNVYGLEYLDTDRVPLTLVGLSEEAVVGDVVGLDELSFGEDHVHMMVVVPPTHFTVSMVFSTREGRWMQPGETKAVGPSRVPGPLTPQAQLQGSEVMGPFCEPDIRVPLDTIPAYHQLKTALSTRKNSNDHPFHLLYGPPAFGKFTIAHGIVDWVASDPAVADVNCIFMDFDPNDVTDEKTFWKQMGQLLEESSACSDCASFTRLAAYWMTRERKQLYVIVYGLEFLLENTEFATRFMDILSDWRTCSWFCGFLGVGSHSVIRQCAQLTGDKLSHLFDASNVISPTPFSLEQMESFFNAAESCCAFSESLRYGTIQHSRGAPGEFAALIRFTDMNEKEKEEWREWERWLKLRAFRKYLVDSEETHLETHAGLGGSGTTSFVLFSRTTGV